MVGAVIGRFQIDELHAGHVALLDHIARKHQHMVVLLGVPASSVSNSENPLDFRSRYLMMRSLLPTALILPIEDRREDTEWSEDVDHAIHTAFPFEPAIIYGGRSSCIPRYSGRHPTEELTFPVTGSATDRRAAIDAQDDPKFRSGVIYGMKRRLPQIYPTVDIAMVRGTEVLLGRKPGEGAWRFPGGHWDPKDGSYESCARRELHEETGLTIEGALIYVGSTVVDDWRTRGIPDACYITILFAAFYSFGDPRAGDDLAEVAWKPIEHGEVPSIVVSEHQPLMRMLAEAAPPPVLR